jgi:hypothetical protein
MHILFVDESGTPPPLHRVDNAPYFVLGGVIVPEDIWSKLAADLTRLKRRFHITGEIKWRYFAPSRPGSRPHSLTHLTAGQKETLRSELYARLCAYKSIKLICVAVHVQYAYQLSYIESADNLYWYAYKQLTERFQYYLQDLERTVGSRIHGIIVCDHRAPKDDERLRELHFQLLNTTGPHSSRYEHLIEGLFIAPSHLSVGIQFADMVAGAVIRKLKDDDDRFIKQIDKTFRRSPTGEINGWGLVKFPKEGW